jgi:hypothetical protein
VHASCHMNHVHALLTRELCTSGHTCWPLGVVDVPYPRPVVGAVCHTPTVWVWGQLSLPPNAGRPKHGACLLAEVLLAGGFVLPWHKRAECVQMGVVLSMRMVLVDSDWPYMAAGAMQPPQRSLCALLCSLEWQAGCCQCVLWLPYGDSDTQP